MSSADDHSEREPGAAEPGDIARPARAYTLLVLPDHGGRSRSFQLSGFMAHFGLWTLGIAAALFVLMSTTWVYFALQAAKVAPLEARVAHLEVETRQVDVIAARFEEVEAAYERLRSIFGAAQDGASDIWLPPTSGRAGPSPATGTAAGQPTSWPLSERGYITQPLLEGAGGEHPGVDVAVPTDSYIRSSGSGRVAEVGDDPILGRFLVIDHADGYQSVYAHTSSVLVEQGAEVRQNEVVALSGSSGRSTAPHLHFEILLNGERVDPLTMVVQP